MLKWKYIFLVLALIELAIGFSDARPTTFFLLGRPIGTVLLGLFLITVVMEKESALYDEQNRAGQPARKPQDAQKRSAPNRPEVAHDPAFTAAHSH